MNPIEQMIEITMTTLNRKHKLSEDEQEKYKLIFTEIFRDGKTPSDALGFDKEMIEHMYAYGFRLYNLGDYKKALKVFIGLSMFDPQDSRFNLAVGAAYQKLNNVVKAVKYYYLCSQQDPSNPMPHFFMYDCFIQGDLWGDAALCLEEVIKRCGSEKDCAELKARAQLLLEPLKVKIAEFEAKLEKGNKLKAA
jgi:type III secretion system low calcium response chaperone LcrH/SycD